LGVLFKTPNGKNLTLETVTEVLFDISTPLGISTLDITRYQDDKFSEGTSIG